VEDHDHRAVLLMPCVTCYSSMASDTYTSLDSEFSISQQVCILSVSLLVPSLGVGPRTQLPSSFR
jgi:hypothetical protein